MSSVPSPLSAATHSISFAPTTLRTTSRDLGDEVRIGSDLTADDGRTQAVARVDGDRRGIAADRIEREHDACHTGVDHELDGDAHACPSVGVLGAVGRRFRVEVARPAALDTAQHLFQPAQPEVRVLNACEAGVGGVLGDRAGADSHRRLVAADSASQRGVRGRDLARDLGRHLTGHQRCSVVARLDDAIEREGGDRKARRDGESRPQQVTEMRALAADELDLVEAELVERNREPGRRHQLRIVTVPVLPSTRTRSPVLIVEVALPVPTTAGRPYSRATIAA